MKYHCSIVAETRDGDPNIVLVGGENLQLNDVVTGQLLRQYSVPPQEEQSSSPQFVCAYLPTAHQFVIARGNSIQLLPLSSCVRSARLPTASNAAPVGWEFLSAEPAIETNTSVTEETKVQQLSRDTNDSESQGVKTKASSEYNVTAGHPRSRVQVDVQSSAANSDTVDNQPVTVFLPASAARPLLECVLAQSRCMDTPLSYLMRLAKCQLVEQLHSELSRVEELGTKSLSPKAAHYGSICRIVAPHKSLQRICTVLLGMLEESRSLALPAVVMITEQIHQFVGSTLTVLNLKKTLGMHLEALRLRSLLSIPAEECAAMNLQPGVPHGILFRLAAAGFFYKSSNKVSRFIHCDSGATIAVGDMAKELLQEPALEHNLIAPKSGFELGRALGSIPLEYSLNPLFRSQVPHSPLAASRHDDFVTRLIPCPSPEIPLLASVSKSGVVSVWLAEPLVQLTKVFTFNVFMKRNNTSTTSETVTTQSELNRDSQRPDPTELKNESVESIDKTSDISVGNQSRGTIGWPPGTLNPSGKGPTSTDMKAAPPLPNTESGTAAVNAEPVSDFHTDLLDAEQLGLLNQFLQQYENHVEVVNVIPFRVDTPNNHTDLELSEALTGLSLGRRSPGSGKTTKGTPAAAAHVSDSLASANIGSSIKSPMLVNANNEVNMDGFYWCLPNIEVNLIGGVYGKISGYITSATPRCGTDGVPEVEVFLNGFESKEYMSVVNLQPARPSERDIVMVLPACESRTEAAALAYYGRIAAIQPPSSNSSEKGQYGLVRPLLLDFSHDSSKPLQKIPMKRLFKISPIVQSEFEDRARVAASEGPAADCMISVLLSTDQNYNNSKEGSGLLCLFKRQQRKVQLLQVLQVAAGTNNSTPMVPTCSAYDPESQALVLGCQYTSSESASKRGALLSYHMSQSNPVFSQLFVIGGQDAGLQAALVELETAPCELQLLPKVDRTPRRDASVGQDEVGLEPDHGKAIDRSAGGEFEDLDGDIEDHDCASSSSGSSPPHQRLLAAESNTPKPSHSAGQRAPTSESRSTVDSTQKYTLDSSCIVSLQPNGVITCHEPVTLNEYTQVSVQFPKNKGPFTSLAASATDHANILIATNTHGQSFTQSITLFELDAKDRVLPQNLPDSQLTSLPCLQALHDQIQWEPLSYKAFGPIDGHQRVVTENGGTVLRWRVRNPLQPDGIEELEEDELVGKDESEQQQQQQDDDISSQSHTKSIQPVEVASGDNHGRVVETDNTTTSQSKLSWELELSEPCAVGKVNIHLALRMRQTTSPQPALVFAGSPGNYAEAQTTRMMRQLYRMTVEAWIRPGWDTQAPLTNGSSEEVLLPVVCKVTHPSDGSKPQFELSITQSGGVVMKIWKAKSADEEEVVSATFKSGATSSHNVLKENEWHHLAATLGRDGLDLYIDGDLYASANFLSVTPMRCDKGVSGDSVDKYGPIRIGGDGGDRSFKGCIRQVRIWSIARSQQDIRDWMHHSVPISAAPTEPAVPSKDLPTPGDPSSGLLVCWPLSKNEDPIAMEQQDGVNNTVTNLVLPCQSGAEVGAGPARLVTADAAKWTEVHVPLMDYTPNLTCSIVAFGQDPNCINPPDCDPASAFERCGTVLVDDATLDSFYVSFDLNAAIARRLHITINHHPQSTLASIDAVTLRLQGKSQSQVADLYHEFLAADDGRFQYFVPLSAMTSVWEFIQSRQLESKLFDLVQTPGVEQNSAAGDTSQSRCVTARRHAAMLLLLDIASTRALTWEPSPQALEKLIRTNLIDCQVPDTTSLAAKLLLYLQHRDSHNSDDVKDAEGLKLDTESGSFNSNFREMLLDTLLNLLDEASSCCQTSKGLREFIGQISACWPTDTLETHRNQQSIGESKLVYERLTNFLCRLGNRLSSKKSPYHNLLRTYFGDYSCPMNTSFADVSATQSLFLPNASGLDITQASKLNGEQSPNQTTTISSTTSGAAANIKAVNGLARANNARIVRVHSKTASATLEGQKLQHGPDQVSLKFSDILQPKKHVIILDLGRRCLIQAANLRPVLEGASNISAAIVTVEAWRDHPPSVGERAILKGNGSEVEIYAYSGFFTYDETGLLGVKSTFPTIVPRNVLIRTGRWYYEVTVVKTTDGVAQVGWADTSFSGDDGSATGVGDDSHSWAFDGSRTKKWNGGDMTWGKKWRDGNVIGCAVDIDAGDIAFSLNGSWASPMGTAFTNVAIDEGLFPAVTGERNFKCKINYGQQPFRYAPPQPDYQPVFQWVRENRQRLEGEEFAHVSSARHELQQRSKEHSSRLVLRRLIQTSKDKPVETNELKANLAHSHGIEARFLRVTIACQEWNDPILASKYYGYLKDNSGITSELTNCDDSSDLSEQDLQLVSGYVAAATEQQAIGDSQESISTRWAVKSRSGSLSHILVSSSVAEKQALLKGSDVAGSPKRTKKKKDAEKIGGTWKSQLAETTLASADNSDYHQLHKFDQSMKHIASQFGSGSSGLTGKLLSGKDAASFTGNLMLGKHLDGKHGNSVIKFNLTSGDSITMASSNSTTQVNTTSTSTSSSKKRSRARITARLGLTLQGISEYVPYLRCMNVAQKAEALQLFHRETLSVLQVAHSMLEDAKHKMTIALERFSVALGTAGGAWDGLDVERDGWSGATQAISETHPMYPSMMEMKSAVNESILVAKRRWEATMARLTWIENLAREEYNIEYALHCAKHSADSPLSDGLVALGNFVKQLDHHRIDAIDTNSESVSRWNEAASEVTKLLLRQMPNPDVIEQQDGFIAPSPSKVWPSVSEAALEQIFAHFCVHCPASAEHRRLSGKLIRRLLRGSGRLAHERSATFATAMLEDHFVTPSATLGPLYAFPERPVFLLVKAIVEGSTGPVAVRCLLSLISKVVGTGGGEPEAITGDFREKLSLVGWSMLLLSHALAVEWNSINSESGESTVKALHKGTVCARCGTSPIIGARFRCVNLADYDLCEVCESADDYPESNFVFLKITKPLPLPPVKDQSGLLVPCGPLLPNLKTKARTFSAKHHSNGNHFQTNSGSHGIHQQGVQWASSSFDVEEGVESGGEGDVEYLEESGVDDDKSDSGSTAAVVKGKSSLKSVGKHKDSKTKGISSIPGKGSKSNHRRTLSRHAQVRFSHGQFNVLHPRIQCDGCGMMPIMGTRYKCVNCDEYNLCARCENGDSAKQHFPLHVFLKLRRPLPLAEGKNPAALIPNHALIPVLLHPSLYPHFHSASEHSASTQVLESDNITTSASGSNGIVLSGAEQGVYDLLEGDSGLPVVKLVRTKSHILRFGRWGKPGSDSTNGISNLVQRTGLDGPNILDSPPATRARKRQFTFEDSDIEAIQVTESGSQSPAPSNGSRNPPTDSFADHQQPVAMVGQSLRRALRIAFSVLSSREVLVPLQLELFLMTSTVLDQLIMRASAADVIAEILQHPRFDDFLHQVAACSQPFVYNAIVRLAEGLCLVESGATAVRRMLRSKAVATLEPPPRDPSFILEVVFVTLSSAKLAPKSWAPQSVPLESQPIAMRKVISEPEPKLEQPLSSATSTNSGVEQLKPRMVAKLLELLEQCPLSSTVIARSWAFAFRILRCFSDPASMLRGGGRLRLQAAVRSVLSAGASMVALVEQDLVDLVSVLLTVHDDGTQMDLQCGLLSVLVDAFLVAQPMNPRLYRKLLQALRESLSRTPEAAVGLNPQHLVALISSVSMALATEAHGAMEALGKDDLDLLYAVLDVVSEPLRVSAVGSTAASVDDSMSALRRSLLKALTTPNGGLPAPGRALLEWLSDPPSLSDDTKKARLRLRHAIAELLSDVLGREGNHAAPLLDICLDILRDPQAGMPEPTAQVIRALISREPLAHHLANALATRELGLGIDQSSLHVGQRAHSHMMSSVSSSICMALGAQVELLPHQRLAQQHNGRTLANVMSGTGKVESGSSAAMLSRYDPLNLFSASGQFSAGVTPGAELDISRYCSAGSKKSLGWFADDEDPSGVGVEEATLSVNRLLTEPANSHPKVTVERPFTETDPVWSFYLALPCDAVLQMIEFEFAQDVPLTVHTSKTSGRSLLPSRVTVDIGSALSRLSPGGIAAVFGNPSKGERRHSSVMVRFTSPVTARFARIKVFGPTGDELGRDWISQRSQPRNQDSNTKTAKPPPMVGEQVVRGPDWLWGDQDGDGAGVVVAITAWEGVPNTGVRVHWNSTGMRNIYRWGYREVGSQHSFKYDLMLAADKGEKQKKVIALTKMKIIATVLAPQLSSSALSTSQRSFAFALELLATAARRFQSVQSSLANGENATALARALLEHLPKAYTSKNARAILVLLAQHNLSLSQQLLSEVLGPVFATTPAHAALAAEWCTLHDDGTAKRLQALWHYVFGQLDSAEQSPLLLPFLDALAVSVEELVVKSLVLTGKSAGLGFLLAVDDGDQVSSTTNSGLKSLDNSQAARITQILLDRSQRATPDSPGEEAALTLLCTLVRADSSVREQVLAQMSELLKLSELDSENFVDTNVHVLNVLRIFGVVCSCCQEMASRSLPLFELVAQSTLRQLSRFLDVVAPESMKQSSSQGTGVNVQVVSKTMVALLQSLSDAMHRTEIKNWAAKSLLDPILSSLMQVRFENLAWQSVFGPLLKLIRSMLNLHGANQKLVAERLVGRLEQTQKLNAFELHLFTDAILMREHVTVSIWHPSKIINQLVHGPVSQVAAQDIVPKKSTFRLNPATCGATIELSDDGLVATQIALEKWGVVRADKELPMKGISTWDVLINTSPKGHIFVGVGTSASNLSTYLGNDKYGWGYIGNRGAWHNKHKAKTYGKDFRTGDVVTVVLNMDEGTCSFALNGEDLGVAFTDLQNRQLYPAFALYQKGDQLTITRCSLASCSPPVVQDVSQVSSVDDKLPSGVSSLLDPKSRLRFHRPGPVYTLPCETTVGRVLEKVGVVTGNRLPTDQHTRTSSVTSAHGGESNCTSENQSSGVAHNSGNVGDAMMDSSHWYDDVDDIDGTSQWYLIQQCQGTVSEDVSRSSEEVKQAFDESETSTLGVHVPPFRAGVNGTSATRQMGEVVLENSHGTELIDIVKETQALRNMIGGAPAVSALSIQLSPASENDKIPQYLCMSPINSFRGTSSVTTLATPSDRPFVTVDGDRMLLGTSPVKQTSGSKLQDESSMEKKPSFTNTFMNANGTDTSPVLEILASLGGLTRVVRLIKQQWFPNQLNNNGQVAGSGDDQEQTSGSITAGSAIAPRRSDVPNEDTVVPSPGAKPFWLKEWLVELEGNLSIPGFPLAFARQKSCIALMLKAMGVTQMPWIDTYSLDSDVDEPLGSLVEALTALFTLQEPIKGKEIRERAVVVGTVDRLLLRLGTLQAETPRDRTRTDKFDHSMGTQRETKHSSKPGSSGEDLEVDSSVSKHDEGEVSLSGLTTPKAPKLKKGVGMESDKSKGVEHDTSVSISSTNTEKKQLWKPGYGHGSIDTTRLEREHEQKQRLKLERTLSTLDCLVVFLEMNTKMKSSMSESFWIELYECFEASCFLKLIMSFFFGTTVKVILDQEAIYRRLLKVVLLISKCPKLSGLLGSMEGVYRSVQELMEEMYHLGQELEEDILGVDDASEASEEHDVQLTNSKTDSQTVEEQSKKTGGEEEKLNSESLTDTEVATWATANHATLPLLINHTKHSVDAAMAKLEEQRKQEAATKANKISESDVGDDVEQNPEGNTATVDSKALGIDDLHKIYEDALRPHLFGGRDMRDNDGKYLHHYSTQIDEDLKGKVSKSRHRRLARELKALAKSLPLHFGSTIAVRIDHTRPFVAQAIISGPANTPYDSGVFEFDIYFPPEYPSDPPKVNLMTTGQGTVRFNPNLYNNGKVCLSLLGTWRGGATGSENWTKNSSLWQVLVSIQSAILGSEFPYFNEPGVESQWGTEQGDLQKRIHSNGGYERLRVATIQHAMVGHLRNPPSGFEDAIREHFSIKRRYIIESVCERWLREARQSDTKGHFKALQRQISDLKVELSKFPTALSDEIVVVSGQLPNSPLSESVSVDGEVGVLALLEENAHDSSDQQHTNADIATGSAGEPKQAVAIASDVVGELAAKTVSNAINMFSGATSEVEMSQNVSVDEHTVESKGTTSLASENQVDKKEGETLATSASASDTFAEKLNALKLMCPQFPKGLLRVALEQMEASTQGSDWGSVNNDDAHLNGAAAWLFTEGEQYLNEHIELFQEK